MSNEPYITHIIEVQSYNPNFGDERECQCGHQYHRHFDSYEDMAPVGCKYCECYEFVENTGQMDELITNILDELNSLKPNWSMTYKYSNNFIRFSNEDGTVMMEYSVYNEQTSYMFSHLYITINDDSNLQGYSKESVTAAYNDLKETVKKYQEEITDYLSKL